MLYKVTPLMQPEPAKARAKDPGAPRKRRATAIYDRDGSEVLISLMCLKCHKVKPLAQFGLRKMADGAIRNQPWCRPCRSGAGTHKPKGAVEETLPPENLVEVETAQSAPPLMLAAEPAESPQVLEVVVTESVTITPPLAGEPDAEQNPTVSPQAPPY